MLFCSLSASYLEDSRSGFESSHLHLSMDAHDSHEGDSTLPADHDAENHLHFCMMALLGSDLSHFAVTPDRLSATYAPRWNGKHYQPPLPPPLV